MTDRRLKPPSFLPLASQIDRSVMRAARYDISPDTLTPDKLPPELQLPEKPTSQPAPKRPTKPMSKPRSWLSHLTSLSGKPVLRRAGTLISIPPTVQAPPPDKIDRSLVKAARFEQAEPLKTGPLHAAAASVLNRPEPTKHRSACNVPPPAAPKYGPLKAAPPPSTSVSQKPSPGSWAAAVVAAQVVIPPPVPPPAAKPPARESENASSLPSNSRWMPCSLNLIPHLTRFRNPKRQPRRLRRHSRRKSGS